MTYHYTAFGIPFVSEIELPALLPYNALLPAHNPVQVRLGAVPTNLTTEGQYADHWTYCNASEMIYNIPEIKFYVSGGNLIIIESTTPDYNAHLIFFYSNALAAILYQRNLIPFHVSGVFTAPGKVALFAAPSGTGKSTLAVKLQELGYAPFTDDTAVLFFQNGKCYAQASYPMIRLWEETLKEQALLNEADKQKIYDNGEKDKFGFSFHEQFAAEPVEVQQIIFLQKEEIAVPEQRQIKNIEAFKSLSDNVYRCHWIPAMQKSKTQFVLISQILQMVPHTLAVRPQNGDFIEKFSLFVENILIDNYK